MTSCDGSKREKEHSVHGPDKMAAEERAGETDTVVRCLLGVVWPRVKHRRTALAWIRHSQSTLCYAAQFIPAVFNLLQYSYLVLARRNACNKKHFVRERVE